jgi:DNA-binding transcriptional MocR family regulator
MNQDDQFGRNTLSQTVPNRIARPAILLTLLTETGRLALRNMSQEQVVDTLGLTSEHVNRTIKQSRAEGLISTRGRHIEIAYVRRLREVCGLDPSYLHCEPVPVAQAFEAGQFNAA